MFDLSRRKKKEPGRVDLKKANNELRCIPETSLPEFFGSSWI
jgi:hypothetical protein